MEVSLSTVGTPQPTSTLQWVWQYRELLKSLIARDLKIQYRGSVLGLMWSLLNPVFLVLVYVIAFKFVLRVHLEKYPLWILTGILHWQFFATVSITSTNILINSANLIHNVHFPRIILPLAVVGSKGIHLLFSMLAYLVLYVPLGGHYWSGMLLYPIALLLQTLFMIGMTLTFCILTLYLRDLQHLLGVGIPMLFWLTPIIYNFSQIPEWAHIWFRLNPMTSFVIAYQEILYLQEVPSLVTWAFMVTVAAISLGLGFYLFERLKKHMEDYL